MKKWTTSFRILKGVGLATLRGDAKKWGWFEHSSIVCFFQILPQEHDVDHYSTPSGYPVKLFSIETGSEETDGHSAQAPALRQMRKVDVRRMIVRNVDGVGRQQ